MKVQSCTTTFFYRLLVYLISIAGIAFVPAQAETNFGVIYDNGALPGYTLFTTYRGPNVYLIDNQGRIINQWDEPDGYSAGASQYLTERGTLVRAVLTGGPPFGAGAGIGGLIREYDWDGNVIWEFPYFDSSRITHHGIVQIPRGKGNVLITAYERKTQADCIEAQLSPEVCNDPNFENRNWEHFLEVKPNYRKGSAKIVWEWHLWDHLLKEGQVASENPGKWNPAISAAPAPGFLNANFNNVDFNRKLNQILISCNTCNEIFVIEHGKNTKHSRGSTKGRYHKGGNFLYRWGNPANYGAGIAEDRKLGFQHGASWVKRRDEHGWKLKFKDAQIGNIILFNNRPPMNPPGPPSSAVVEIEPPYKRNGSYAFDEDLNVYGPSDFSSIVSEYYDSKTSTYLNFFSPFLSNPQRLPNGRTLINIGVSGTVVEVDENGFASWKFINPAYSHNPGGPASAGGGKCVNGYLPADAAALPEGDPDGEGPLAAATNVLFRVVKYSPNFKGFKRRNMQPGPLLTDLEGTTDPTCSF